MDVILKGLKLFYEEFKKKPSDEFSIRPSKKDIDLATKYQDQVGHCEIFRPPTTK